MTIRGGDGKGRPWADAFVLEQADSELSKPSPIPAILSRYEAAGIVAHKSARGNYGHAASHRRASPFCAAEIQRGRQQKATPATMHGGVDRPGLGGRHG